MAAAAALTSVASIAVLLGLLVTSIWVIGQVRGIPTEGSGFGYFWIVLMVPCGFIVFGATWVLWRMPSVRRRSPLVGALSPLLPFLLPDALGNMTSQPGWTTIDTWQGWVFPAFVAVVAWPAAWACWMALRHGTERMRSVRRWAAGSAVTGIVVSVGSGVL